MDSTLVIVLVFVALLIGIGGAGLYFHMKADHARITALEDAVRDLQANPTRARENRILDAIAVALDLEEEADVHTKRLQQLRRVLFDCNSKKPKADAPAGLRPGRSLK